jgi:hypothetical protein
MARKIKNNKKGTEGRPGSVEKQKKVENGSFTRQKRRNRK